MRLGDRGQPAAQGRRLQGAGTVGEVEGDGLGLGRERGEGGGGAPRGEIRPVRTAGAPGRGRLGRGDVRARAGTGGGNGTGRLLIADASDKIKLSEPSGGVQ